MEQPEYVERYLWCIIVNFVHESYKDSVSLLFVCLIWLASKSIQVIVNDVETRFSTIKDQLSSQVSVQQVIKWKRDYFITLDWIEEIDGFFGPVLVISFTNIFLTTSIFSFRILNRIFGGIDKKSLLALINIVQNITTVSGLVFVTHTMKKQVKSTLNSFKIMIKV